MTDRRSHPPKGALWLLQHACPGKNEALMGDLLERFREGKPISWFWRQVLIAVTLAQFATLRRHWPEFGYAIGGMALPVAFGTRVHDAGFRLWLHWWTLPWPLSQIVKELNPSFVLALAALPVLTIGLVIAQRFRWTSVLRTALFTMALITLLHYSLDFLHPWITRPVPGHSNQRMVIIPAAVQLVLFFLTFFLPAWLGCRRPGHTTEHPHRSTS